MSKHDLCNLAVQNLRRSGGDPPCEAEVGRAVLAALVDAGIDLRSGPTLEEMKALLAEVVRVARREALLEPSAA